MSASGHAYRDINSLMTRAVFTLADTILSGPFFRSTGGLLENVNNLALGMTSDKGLDTFSVLSLMNSVNMALLMFGASLRQLAISGSMTSLVSKVISSGPVSLKRLITVPSLTRLYSALR